MISGFELVLECVKLSSPSRGSINLGSNKITDKEKLIEFG
jgi:hypothetical protein